MNEYTVNSFKDAINISLDKLGYGRDNFKIIKKLIVNALNGNSNYFTRTNEARAYVEKMKSNNGILNEMKNSIRALSNDVSDIIDKYIEQNFKKRSVYNLRDEIKENSNFDRIIQKIRYINISSSDDIEFQNKVWDTFSFMYVDRENPTLQKEIRYDMLEAALCKAEKTRDNATILKNINLYNEDLTVQDAIKLVEEYVFYNNINDLLIAMDHNQRLSGLLLQNLLDYVYFKKEEKNNVDNLNDIDNIFKDINDIKLKAKIIEDIINGNNIEEYKRKISRNDLLIGLLKNTLLLNMYSVNKDYIDYDERKLYSGETLIDEDILQNLMKINNDIANNMLINGINTSVDDMVNIINNLSDEVIHFLANMYAVSRSNSINIYRIDNAISSSNRNQIHVLNILDSEKLYNKLYTNNQKSA